MRPKRLDDLTKFVSNVHKFVDLNGNIGAEFFNLIFDIRKSLSEKAQHNYWWKAK